MIRRLIVRCALFAVIVVLAAMVLEFALEARDVGKYMPGQTFAQVGDARIRYRIRGIDRPGATVVYLSGTGGVIEQADQLQTALSNDVPSLAYDRAGYGFSRGSTAHTAVEQADELAGLLHALRIEKPVVLLAFSDSNQLARVFAGRYPEKTAALYLIDPWMPEFDVILRHGPRSLFVRWVTHDFVASSLGLIRLSQRLQSWQGPESLVEQRAEAALARRPHYWALVQEWYVTPVSHQQTREAPLPPTVPLEVIFPKPAVENADTQVLAKLRTELVARSTRGKLVEVPHVVHDRLIKSGPEFDYIVAQVKQLSKAAPLQ